MGIYGRHYDTLEEIASFQKDRDEILKDLNMYNHKSLLENTLEFDKIFESARLGFYVSYDSLPTTSQEISIGYEILSSMIEDYVK